MSDKVCPKCGCGKSDSLPTECPQCGIIYAKYKDKFAIAQAKRALRKRPQRDAQTPLDLKSKFGLLIVTAVTLWLLLYPWYLYLHERHLEAIGEQTRSTVNAVREERSGKSTKTYAYYSFNTDRQRSVSSRYATTKLKRGDAIDIVYDPNDPEDNFPLQGRITLLYSVLFSLFASVVFFAAMCFSYPNFRAYIKNKLAGER